MIKKSELRIGNYYQYRDKSYTRFGQIKNGADIDEMEDDDFEPIQISPEILEKAGFGRTEGSSVLKKLIKYEDESYPASLQHWIGTDQISICRSGIYAIATVCPYVHQLQNLYFSLTGEELPIQL